MLEQLAIWTNANLPPEQMAILRQGIGESVLITAEGGGSNLVAGGPSELLAKARIAFGQPDPEQLMALASLQWAHLTSAGYTRYDRTDVRGALAARGAMLTTSSSVYDEPCAQHVLAFMLAEARQLPECFRAQASNRSWNSSPIRAASCLLKGQRILILGYGAIARRLCELLAPFNLNIIAFRRDVQGNEPITVLPISELDRYLPEADHVINILPANASTEGLFGEASFDGMKDGAVFYNIGRGTTVDQMALLSAVRSRRIRAAYLDVTDPEPLPADHPLWLEPNCTITPHTAGGHADEFERLVQHFLSNLSHFTRGEALADRVM